jgi:hypothetical protein
MFDSTVVRAHVSAAGAKKGKTTKRSAVRAMTTSAMLASGQLRPAW